MRVTDNPKVLLEMEPVIHGYLSKSGRIRSQHLFEDCYWGAVTGMIENPEDFPTKKSFVNCLIAKTEYELNCEHNQRRNDTQVAARMPAVLVGSTEEGTSGGYEIPVDSSGSFEYPYPAQSHRHELSWFRELPTTFLWTLPTRTRQAASLLRDGLSYAQVAELLQTSVPGLIGSVRGRYQDWVVRESFELSDKDKASLKRFRLPIVPVIEMLLLGYQIDIVCHKLPVTPRQVQTLQYEALRLLPHLRPHLGRWNR